MKRYDRFADFYPVYLAMHSHPTNRRLHLVGNGLAVGALVYAIVTRNPWALLAMPVFANAFAWAGHFFYERNTPATFRHPWLSFRGDWRMWWEMLTGKIPF